MSTGSRNQKFNCILIPDCSIQSLIIVIVDIVVVDIVVVVAILNGVDVVLSVSVFYFHLQFIYFLDFLCINKGQE